MSILDHAEVIRTYGDLLSTVVEPFFAGRYYSTVLISRPGLLKTSLFRERLSHLSHLIQGWTRPVQSAIESFHHRNKLLIFDDTENLWKSDLGRVLIRAQTENLPRKTIQLTTTNKDLERAGVPKQFVTSSKCAFLANSFRFGKSDELEAILDRSQVFHFDPTPLEIHRRVGTWLWPQAQDIYDYIRARLHLIDNLSARTYVKVCDRMQAGLDWQGMIRERFLITGTKRLVMELETDPTLVSVDEKVHHFMQLSGKARSTYYHAKRELRKSGHLPIPRAPWIRLRGEPPEELDLETEVLDAHGQPASREDAEDSGPTKTITLFPDVDANGAADERPERPRKRRRRPVFPPPDDLPPVERLRRLLQRAIDEENYALAQKLKRQLEELKDDHEDEDNDHHEDEPR